MPRINSNPNAATSGEFTIGGDLPVHRLGFGAMRVTGAGVWGEPEDEGEALRVLERVVELGITLIDTADAYGPDVSERLIATALWPYPEGLVIATKGGLLRDGPGQWRPNGRPKHLRQACEGSLRRLRLERIDLYQLHRPDPDVPVEDSIGALADLQREGKIRHIGVSNVDLEELERSRSVATIVSVQNRYNLQDRSSEAVLGRCVRDGLAFLPWAPLRSGALDEKGGVLQRVAAHHHSTAGQVALAWLLAHAPVILPIPGTSSVAHLEENVAAASLELADDEMAELDAAQGARAG